jgi:DNA-binding NarL/FixJ family response regulator
MMTVARPSGRQSLIVQVLPHRSAGVLRLGNKSPAAILFVTDPEMQPALDEDLLRRALKITRAEARIAVLLTSGGSVSAIAGQLEVQENTVRAHLKSIFAKTGARNQASLTKLVLGASAGGPLRKI